MKVKILDLCVFDPNKQVYHLEEEELFQVFDYEENPEVIMKKIKDGKMDELYSKGNWKTYIENVNKGNLDGYNFNLEDIDKEVFIFDDGGDLFRLKNGTYMNICWRGNVCRVWKENNKSLINKFNKKLK